MYYLRITDETFGFVTSDIHNIEKSDIAISDVDYMKFFEIQQTRSLKLKEKLPLSGGLFDFVEAYIPESSGSEQPSENQQLQLALAEAIEKQESDNLASQLALAEYIESQAQGGE